MRSLKVCGACGQQLGKFSVLLNYHHTGQRSWCLLSHWKRTLQPKDRSWVLEVHALTQFFKTHGPSCPSGKVSKHLGRTSAIHPCVFQFWNGAVVSCLCSNSPWIHRLNVSLSISSQSSGNTVFLQRVYSRPIRWALHKTKQLLLPLPKNSLVVRVFSKREDSRFSTFPAGGDSKSCLVHAWAPRMSELYWLLLPFLGHWTA